MAKRWRGFWLALCLLAGVAGPIWTSDAAAQTGVDQPAGEIEVEDDAASDDRIRRRIRGLLEEIGGYGETTVAVRAGVVTLSGRVIDGQAEERLVELVSRVDGVAAINRDGLEQTGRLAERLTPAWQRLARRGHDLLLNLPIFAVAVVAFFATTALGWLAVRSAGLWRWLAPNDFIAEIYSSIARIVSVLLGLVIALEILNATALLGAVLGAAGVAGLAIGFAVRDTVENFIASVLLSLRQPFSPDDFVEIDGDLGSVARLTSRATILISPDGNHIRIPNATVYKGRIVNYTRDAHRRFTFELGVDSEADLSAALGVGVRALEGLDYVLSDPPVSAWTDRVGDSNVVLTFAAWIDQRRTDYLKGRGEAIRQVKVALESQGFGLPEPIYRLRIDGRGAAADLPGAGAGAPSPTTAPPTAARVERDLTKVPEAASPDRVERAGEEAAAREREAADSGADLLAKQGRTE